MKKIFTIALAALFSASMLANVAVLSWNMGVNGAELGPEGEANVIVGQAGSLAEGWTIAMTGNTAKNWGKGGGTIMDSEQEYTTLKNSNGVQITVTLPEGLYASQVEFRAVTNDDATKGTLKEFDGGTCKDTVHSLKDYSNPTVIVKTLETPKNVFTFTFGGKQVCFVAFVTYSDEVPEAPKPFGLLSWQLGENGAEATAANSITGAAGSAAEGWTIAISGDNAKNWGAGGKLTFKGNTYKTLKNSNGLQNTVTLPEGLYATDIEFRAVTNDDASVGSLKEFDGESVKDTVFSLKNYDNPTVIFKEFATPKNVFTFTFGGKQVCFLAIVHYTDEAPEEPGEPGGSDEGIDNTSIAPKAVKMIENGQIVIIKNGIRYNALGTQL